VLGDTDSWLYTVTIAGALTLLAGGYLALIEHDLKRILASSTIAALGMLTMLLGMGTPLAIKAAMAVLLGHALYKGALFLVAGAVDHAAGIRDVSRLSGLGAKMPLTAAAAGLAALSMAGLPPLFGFIGKEAFLEATLHAPLDATSVTLVAVAGSSLLVTAAVVVGVRPFVGGPTEDAERAHEVSAGLWLGPLLLAGIGLVVGIAPALVDTKLVAPATAAALGYPAESGLALWHGFNRALGLSALALVAGTALFLARGTWQPAAASLARRARWTPGAWYERALTGLDLLARGQTRVLQSGYLRVYLLLIIAATLGIVGFTLVDRGGLRAPGGLDGARFYEVALVPIMLAGALMAAMTNSRLAAVAALGVVGYGIALVYLLFGAPDLAMAQVLVETLIVILLVFAFYHLPRFARLSSAGSRLRDAAVAATAGALMTALALVVANVDQQSGVSEYYAQNSAPLAQGRNVVNAVLVDFRALDTLGEITVLSLAAIGVYALLKLRPTKGGPQ
jgi:multicomponent Na+:H+ antiporter subunit A